MSDLSSDPCGALAAYGWSERVRALFRDVASEEPDPPGVTPLEPARVVRVERSNCLAATARGDERRVVAADLPAVGDWVTLDGNSVRAVLPRWSALVRADPSGAGEQVLAANLDLVLIAAPADRLNAGRVERELAVAWESGATPLVLVTKCDLAPPGTVAELARRLAGTDVAAVSAHDGSGLEELRARLRPARTAVLIGPSGAGKSSLINSLTGGEPLATGAVREGDRRGRHTTTSRQLVPIVGGGVLIDTPGLRSVGLAGDPPLGEVFPEIEELASHCRFDDCRHEREPGCAVSDAAAGGLLDQGRLSSYRKLHRELTAEGASPGPRRAAGSRAALEGDRQAEPPARQAARPLTAAGRRRHHRRGGRRGRRASAPPAGGRRPRSLSGRRRAG